MVDGIEGCGCRGSVVMLCIVTFTMSYDMGILSNRVNKAYRCSVGACK